MQLLVRHGFCRWLFLPLLVMVLGFAWHPWRHLRVRYPDVRVSCRHRLPDRLMGLQAGRRIWMCRTLTQAERRCTLTHEILHLERGLVADPAAAAREERIVDEIAARRLITLGSLVDGLRWSRDPAQLAEHLWVDLHLWLSVMINPISVADRTDNSGF